ncbi:uncharacterized protein M421DRAFT_102748 [Didymella exigua CBS 183.55]|uniref:Peptidase M20 domain-containing protein 2 n=1 Tax=Didymella exigua CBS 183.55 TaxID=1150837 RepID=A0A6A5RFC1_9PLEO|nr:uncharacterized protein M421DRAFT_102748 [Didymella exigua CBS 183.55]KAF1926149.1 hypothetical protein M421DRAFT_102748 [Didymella exigua CBS 183.55]
MGSYSESETALGGARSTIISTIDGADAELHKINKALHGNPELGYEEHFAHQTITEYLSSLGFNSIDQVAVSSSSVIICAEYDALPGTGHSCGHELIATSSIATFIAAAEAMKKHSIEGRLRILGAPAEEGGGGKAKLIDAGTFPKDTSAAIMAHPLAAHQFKTEFRGKPAHAAGEPWDGVNALGAAVSAYSNVGLLRQQMEPDERVHGVIEAGGTVPNVITDYTRMNWNVRSPTMEWADRLLVRVKNCIEAAALASGCELEYITSPTYLNLRANRTLCKLYAQGMDTLRINIQIDQEKMMNASTDMGNVSRIIPIFHGAFVIPAKNDVSAHNPAFAALDCAKGIAMLTLRFLVDEGVARRAKEDFETDDG